MESAIGTFGIDEFEYGEELLSEEEFNSLVESDSENETEESRENIWDSARPMEVNGKPVPLWLGQTFINKGEFKEAVKSYAVDCGKKIKFEKNDKVRCIAICKQEGCKWKVRLWKNKYAECWRISMFNNNHEGCGSVYMNPSKSPGKLTKDGVRVSRKNIVLRCSICREKGHNAKKCPHKPCNLPNVQETSTSDYHVEPVNEMQDQVVEIPIQTQPEVENDTQDEFNVPVEVVNMVVDELNLPVDPLIDVGDRIEQRKVDKRSASGFSVTTKGVRISFGPPKIKKRKDKQVERHGGMKKTLGLSKTKHTITKTYCTRASQSFKSKFFGNDKDPINID